MVKKHFLYLIFIYFSHTPVVSFCLRFKGKTPENLHMRSTAPAPHWLRYLSHWQTVSAHAQCNSVNARGWSVLRVRYCAKQYP